MAKKEEKSRYKTIIDSLDISILNILEGGNESHAVMELKDLVNIAHNSLKAHLTRLEGKNLIEIKKEKNGVRKAIKITKKGKMIKALLED